MTALTEVKEELELPELTPDQLPESRYFKTRELFDIGVGQDFLKKAAKATADQKVFIVGLAHGRSPAGAYAYIVEHFTDIRNPHLLRFTFTNSPLPRQREVKDVMDARSFLRTLLRKKLITNEQVLGRDLDRTDMTGFTGLFNPMMEQLLSSNGKTGLDYVFVAADPTGRVAAISRKSDAFESDAITVVVDEANGPEVTFTPSFLLRSARIAFLATKSDKRRPLAWLYARWGRQDQSPSFIRFADHVHERVTVFVDDKALTWPQVMVHRDTPYGTSTIRVDLAKNYREGAKDKLPVVLLIHGFMGLNSFDGILTALPSHRYIAAAMHYGSIPSDLPPSQYSHHIVSNIDAVVAHFGERGHPVYIFDHSMGNVYFLMMDRALDQLPGISRYLCGRIGANPFFGEEAKHALLGFLDNVILPSGQNPIERAMFYAARTVIPWDSRRSVRRRAISLSDWLIERDSSIRERVWSAVKARILYLMTSIGSLPDLNRIPVQNALNRLPAKVFAIQVHSALEESMIFDEQQGLLNIPQRGIPVLILKSTRDSVAKFVARFYDGVPGVEVKDVTDTKERDLFREHLFHMVNPLRTVKIIDRFIRMAEEKRTASQ